MATKGKHFILYLSAALTALLGGLPATAQAEHYVVVDAQQLSHYWVLPKQTQQPPTLPLSLSRLYPNGCIAATVRIEPDGSVHQVQRITSHWNDNLMPGQKQHLDQVLMQQIGRMRFVAAPSNKQRTPVYSYFNFVLSNVRVNELIAHAQLEQALQQEAKYLQALCTVPHFVRDIAQATDTPIPSATH